MKVYIWDPSFISYILKDLGYIKADAKELYTTCETSLTDDEKYLHQDIADAWRVTRCWAAVLSYLHRGEAHVVGNGDGYVEGGQQDQPIPAGLERTVVKEDEAGLLDVRHLVLWDRVGVGPKNTLDMLYGSTHKHS